MQQKLFSQVFEDDVSLCPSASVVEFMLCVWFCLFGFAFLCYWDELL